MKRDEDLIDKKREDKLQKRKKIPKLKKWEWLVGWFLLI